MLSLKRILHARLLWFAALLLLLSMSIQKLLIPLFLHYPESFNRCYSILYAIATLKAYHIAVLTSIPALLIALLSGLKRHSKLLSLCKLQGYLKFFQSSHASNTTHIGFCGGQSDQSAPRSSSHLTRSMGYILIFLMLIFTIRSSAQLFVSHMHFVNQFQINEVVQIISDEQCTSHNSSYRARIIGDNQPFESSVLLQTSAHENRLNYGAIYHIQGTVSLTSSDRLAYLYRNGMSAQIKLTRAEEPSESWVLHNSPCRAVGLVAWLLKDVRESAQDMLAGTLDEAHALMAALALGDRRGLILHDMYDSFQITGLSHVVAVSGMHLCIAIACIERVFSYCHLSRGIKMAGIICIAFAFVCISGVQLSTLRAYGMLVAASMSQLIGRKTHALNILGLSLIAILFIDPYAATSQALHLSALSVLGLVLFAQPITHLLCSKMPQALITYPMIKPVLETGGLTFAAQLATLPYILAVFGRLSLISLLANIVVVPLITYLLITTFLYLIGAYALQLIARSLMYCLGVSGVTESSSTNSLLMYGMELTREGFIVIRDCAHQLLVNVATGVLHIINFFASFPYASLTITPGLLGCVAGILLIICAFLSLTRRRIMRFFLSILGISILVWAICHIAFTQYQTAVTMLDVGQGDAFLLQSHGSTLMVDTGPSYAVVNQLKEQEISHLDTLVITHLDHDHIGGLHELVGYITVDQLVIAQGVSDSLTAEQLDDCRKLKIQSIVEVQAGEHYEIPGIRLHIISPEHKVSGHENEDSIVARAELQPSYFPWVLGDACSIMLTGDAEASLVERAIKHSDSNGAVDILKVSHHGAQHSVSKPLIELTQPHVALISCSAQNSYGHPSDICCHTLSCHSILYFVSALDGSVTVRFKDKQLWVE